MTFLFGYANVDRMPLEHEYWALRVLVIDGRVSDLVRNSANKVLAMVDDWELRLIGTQVTDFAYGAVPYLLAHGRDVSDHLRLMREQVRHDAKKRGAMH